MPVELRPWSPVLVHQGDYNSAMGPAATTFSSFSIVDRLLQELIAYGQVQRLFRHRSRRVSGGFEGLRFQDVRPVEHFGENM